MSDVHDQNAPSLLDTLCEQAKRRLIAAGFEPANLQIEELQKGIFWEVDWPMEMPKVRLYGSCSFTRAHHSPKVCIMALTATLPWTGAAEIRYNPVWLAFSQRVALRWSPLRLQIDQEGNHVILNCSWLVTDGAQLEPDRRFGYLADLSGYLVSAINRLDWVHFSSSDAEALVDQVFEDHLEAALS
jgi:hypothetical protein